MGSIQSVDPQSGFRFVGDFHCHHSEWLASRINDTHGVAGLDLVTVADCSQSVNGPIHIAGRVLDLVLTVRSEETEAHIILYLLELNQ